MNENNADSVKEDDLRKLCVGSDVYSVRRRLKAVFSLSDEQIDIIYKESATPRFTVLSCQWNSDKETILLEAASGNAIRHLPANFQENEFLRKFLMLFQHIMNENMLLLDNLYRYFRPVESPADFLPALASWFGTDMGAFGDESALRRYLQHALILYRCRGTALGIRAHIALACGVVPEIQEGVLPYHAMEIGESMPIESGMFEGEQNADCFTVYMPVLREEMDGEAVRRISRILAEEKPAHTVCYLCFKEKTPVSRKITVMADEGSAIDEGIIAI